MILVDQAPHRLDAARQRRPPTCKAFDGIRDLLRRHRPGAAARLHAPRPSRSTSPAAAARPAAARASRRSRCSSSPTSTCTCAECNGARFRPRCSRCASSGRTIRDVLDLTVARGAARSSPTCPRSRERLQPLADVGLDYLRLGQPLSDAVGRRVAAPQARRAPRPRGARRTRSSSSTSRPPACTSPTSRSCSPRFSALVERGHSLVVIEHNLEVVKCADWVIDLGPEGGDGRRPRRRRGHARGRRRARRRRTPARFLRAALGAPAPTARPTPSRRGRRAPRDASARSASSAPGSTTCATSASTCRATSFIVVTGLLGSGKSTLAFDILYAEGQRRYLDSLSTYARQFVQGAWRARTSTCSPGCRRRSPSSSACSRGGRKSTVATVTEIYHYLRLLYAKIGVQHCTAAAASRSARRRARQIVDRIRRELRAASGHAAGAGRCAAARAIYKELLPAARKLGFTQARIDGKRVRAQPPPACSPATTSTTSTSSSARDLAPGARGARRRARRRRAPPRQRRRSSCSRRAGERLYSERLFCAACGIGYEALDPRLFSFNSRQGACPACDGIGSAPTLRARAADRRSARAARRGAARGARAPGGARREARRPAGRSRSHRVPLDRPFAQARPPRQRQRVLRRQRRARAARTCCRSCWSTTRTAPRLDELLGERPCPTCDGPAPQRRAPRPCASHGRADLRS